MICSFRTLGLSSVQKSFLFQMGNNLLVNNQQLHKMGKVPIRQCFPSADHRLQFLSILPSQWGTWNSSSVNVPSDWSSQ